MPMVLPDQCLMFWTWHATPVHKLPAKGIHAQEEWELCLPVSGLAIPDVQSTLPFGVYSLACNAYMIYDVIEYILYDISAVCSNPHFRLLT